MRIYKKEGHLFRLFSLILVLGLSLAVLLPAGAKNEGENEDGRFVLLLSETEEVLVPHLHVGDRVIDRQSRSILGDILDIQVKESRREIFSAADGALVSARVPERCDVFLTLHARKTRGMLFAADETSIRLGQTYHFCTYDFTGTGRVVELI